MLRKVYLPKHVLFIINTVIRGAHDNVRTCVIQQFESLNYCFALKSQILFDNHKRFCWLSVILTYSTSQLTCSVYIFIGFYQSWPEKELISSNVYLFLVLSVACRRTLLMTKVLQLQQSIYTIVIHSIIAERAGALLMCSLSFSLRCDSREYVVLQAFAVIIQTVKLKYCNVVQARQWYFPIFGER